MYFVLLPVARVQLNPTLTAILVFQVSEQEAFPTSQKRGCQGQKTTLASRLEHVLHEGRSAAEAVPEEVKSVRFFSLIWFLI